MLELLLNRPASDPVRVLALGAHPDDIEIGCAGTLLRLVEQGAVSELWWVVLSGTAERAAEAQRARRRCSRASSTASSCANFADGFFPYDGARDQGVLRAAQGRLQARPRLHPPASGPPPGSPHDVRDHVEHVARPPHPRVRDPEVRRRHGRAEPLRAARRPPLRRKVAHLFEHVPLAGEKHWFTEDLFSGLLRLRGMECQSPTPSPRPSTAARPCWPDPRHRPREKRMIFTETKLRGAFIIDLERREDNRGFFARTFCQNEFEEHGLKPDHRAGQPRVRTSARARCAACTSSFRPPPRRSSCAARAARSSTSSSTCVRRARRTSSTSRSSSAPTTTARSTCPSASRTATRCSRTTTETNYQVGEFYTPGVEGGLRYDDPRSGSRWPLPVTEISEKDAAWAPLAEVEDELKRRMACRAEAVEGPMIIVDTALRRREAGRPADPGRRSSAPASWRRVSPTRSSTAFRACALAAIYGRKPERALERLRVRRASRTPS